MNRTIILIVVFLLCYTKIFTQNILEGIVMSHHSKEPLENVSIRINKLNIETKTTENGVFKLKNIPKGKHLLQISFLGYETQNFPIDLNTTNINLGEIILYKLDIEQEDLSIITITDDELNDDANSADNIAGLLQSSRDVFLRTAAFEFSSSFLEFVV